MANKKPEPVCICSHFRHIHLGENNGTFIGASICLIDGCQCFEFERDYDA